MDIDCACIDVDWTDGELAECFNAVEIKSRKQHKCCECGEAIKAGTMYERATGKWEGLLDTFKTCADCLSIRKAFFALIYMEVYGLI